MLFPKKVKYRKWQTARRNPKRRTAATRGTTLAFGGYGLKAETHGRITSNQIEAARKTISRLSKKGGKMWIRIFPDRPFTQKPAEVKMGKGKGDLEGYCARIYPGQVLFEVDGAAAPVSAEALRKGGTKMPLKTKVVARV
jgi:large subunit ribosomal protein L16